MHHNPHAASWAENTIITERESQAHVNSLICDASTIVAAILPYNSKCLHSLALHCHNWGSDAFTMKLSDSDKEG
jgi:hypothetical protein